MITTGDIVGGILVLVLLLAACAPWVIGPLRVNLVRRRRGLPPIAWRDIRRSRLPARALRTATVEELAADRALSLQMQWEKHLYHQEISQRGYPSTRKICKEHGRYCRTAGGPHAPGGDDNESPPDGWDPDAAPMANWEKDAKG